MGMRYMLVGPNQKYQARVIGHDYTVFSMGESLIPELLWRPLSLDISQPRRHRKRGDSIHLYLTINGRGVDSHLSIGADPPEYACPRDWDAGICMHYIIVERSLGFFLGHGMITQSLRPS